MLDGRLASEQLGRRKGAMTIEGSGRDAHCFIRMASVETQGGHRV